MIENKQLEYFIATAECGSFHEAAKVLYTTQPNVSKTIANLERQLGCALFLRDTRGITLTPKGRSFYERARVVVADLKLLEDDFVRERVTGDANK